MILERRGQKGDEKDRNEVIVTGTARTLFTTRTEEAIREN